MNANNGNDDNFDIENPRNFNEPNIIPNIERNVINIKFEEKKQGSNMVKSSNNLFEKDNIEENYIEDE